MLQAIVSRDKKKIIEIMFMFHLDKIGMQNDEEFLDH